MYDLQFTPKNDEELIDLLEVGEGDFEVVAAERKDSKNGNPMIKLSLKVWDKNGAHSFIYDYLMLTDKNYSLRKIKHFCDSCGLEENYKSGKLNATDCMGKAGKLKIGIQKDTTGQYPDKNNVNDYIPTKTQQAKANSAFTSAQDEKFDDDIPF